MTKNLERRSDTKKLVEAGECLTELICACQKACDIENEQERIDYALKRLPEEETIRKHIRLLEKYRLYKKVRDMIGFYRDLQEYTLPDDAIVCEPLLGTPPLEVSYF